MIVVNKVAKSKFWSNYTLKCEIYYNCLKLPNTGTFGLNLRFHFTNLFRIRFRIGSSFGSFRIRNWIRHAGSISTKISIYTNTTIIQVKLYLGIFQVSAEANVEEGQNRLVQALNLLDKGFSIHTQGKEDFPEHLSTLYFKYRYRNTRNNWVHTGSTQKLF